MIKKRKRILNKNKLSIVKSDLIKELANNYPNFLRKDLTKLFDIVVYEMKNSLKKC